MRLHLADAADIGAIAALHRSQIPWGLLSDLGEAAVTRFYRVLITSGVGFVVLAEDGEGPVGFASAVTDWPRFYRAFVRHAPWSAVPLLVRAWSGRRWRRLLETRRYVTASQLPRAELASIALAPSARGRGIGRTLVAAVLAELGRRGVTAVRVTTAADNGEARRLYESAGFRLHGELEIHPHERAAVYVRDVPAVAAGGPGRS